MGLLLQAILLALAVSPSLSRPAVKETSYQHAAVATDAAQCSEIGVELLKKGGNAVDAAVGSLLCVGVINLQSTGLGGGGFFMYYDVETRETFCIDFREKAPGIIPESAMERYIEDPTSTTIGGLAIGVPGQVKGLHEAHTRFGDLPWYDVVEPSIKVAREGFAVTPAVALAVSIVGNQLDENYQTLSDLLHNPETGQLYKEGEILRQPQLANTLESIARSGSMFFYNSSFTEEMVAELASEYGSILRVEDFLNYEAATRDPLISEYKGMKVHSFPPPASGSVLSLVFNILNGYDLEEIDSLAYHRIVEAYKFAYGQRLSLGDPDYNETISEVVDFMLDVDTAADMRSRITDYTTHNVEYYLENQPLLNPDSHGTTHLSVIDEKGNAVGITSTINLYFGSLSMSSSSGIIFNNEMDDFSVPGRNNSFDYPPSPSNYIKPYHRPLSSSSPTIVTDEDGAVVMVAGASGGSKIPTATSQVLLNTLTFSLPLEDAVSRPRLHHQLIPNVLQVENDFSQVYIEGLEERHHVIRKTSSVGVVQAIYKEKGGLVYAASDKRKGGEPSGY